MSQSLPDVPEPSDPPLRGRLGKLTLIMLGIVGLGAAVAAAVGGGDRIEPPSGGSLAGTSAPDFAVPLLDGGTFDLSEHLATDGRPVVLNLWASWCIPCRDELPEFDRVAADTPGVAFIGVAVEDQETAARNFASEVGVDFPLGFDASGTVAADYRTFGLPVTVLIADDGTVVRQINGRLPEDQLRAEVASLPGA